MRICGIALALCVFRDAAAFVIPAPSRTVTREATLRRISLLDDYMSDINDDDGSKKNEPKPVGGKKNIKAPENTPFSPFSNDIPAAPVNTDRQARLDRLNRLGGDTTSTPVAVQNAEAVDTSTAVFPPATGTNSGLDAGGTPAFPTTTTPPPVQNTQTPASTSPPVRNTAGGTPAFPTTTTPPPVQNSQTPASTSPPVRNTSPPVTKTQQSSPPVKNDRPKQRSEPSFIAERPPRPDRKQKERSEPAMVAERPPRPDMQKKRPEPSFIAERPPRPDRQSERKEPSFVAERPPRPEMNKPPARDRAPPPVKDRNPAPVRDRAPPPPVKDRNPPPVRDRSPPPVRERNPPPVKDRSPPPMRDSSPPPVRNTERSAPTRSSNVSERPPSRSNSAPMTVRNDPGRPRSPTIDTGRAADAKDIWDLSPVLVQGGSLETWSFPSPDVETVQVRLETQGRPLNAHVELWQGPNNSPQTMKVYLQDGSERPFNAVIATPRGSNAVAVRNVANLEFPVAACVDVDTGPPLADRISERKSRLVQGGAVHSVPFDAYVSSVQVLLTTDGRPLNATIELIQGPNNNKQVIKVYTEDGYDRPFFAMVETPGTGNVVRIVNDSPMEFPMYASVEPFRIGVSRSGSSDLSRVEEGQAAW